MSEAEAGELFLAIGRSAIRQRRDAVASEFGAKDFDELNIIEPGGNYGWPRFEGPSDDPGYRGPVAWWSPTSVASPSGIAIADGSVWVATLRGVGQSLARLAEVVFGARLHPIALNLAAAERLLVARAIAVSEGNLSQAARLLGVNRTSLYRWQEKSVAEPAVSPSYD